MRLRILFLFAIITHVQVIHGQDSPLFCIVTCSDDVLLDGNKVVPGQLVYSHSKALFIPEDGYAGVVSNEGYVYKFLKSILIKKVIKKVHQKNMPSRYYGAVHRGNWGGLEVVGAPSNQFSSIEGDTILIAIIDNTSIGPPYSIEFTNMFGDVLLIDSISKNMELRDVRSLLDKNNKVLYSIKPRIKNSTTDPFLIKKPSPNAVTQLQFDLSRMPEDWKNNGILKIAIYELNGFYYDHLFQLYKLEKSKQVMNDAFFTNYLTTLKEKYHYDQFEFYK